MADLGTSPFRCIDLAHEIWREMRSSLTEEEMRVAMIHAEKDLGDEDCPVTLERVISQRSPDDPVSDAKACLALVFLEPYAFQYWMEKEKLSFEVATSKFYEYTVKQGYAGPVGSDLSQDAHDRHAFVGPEVFTTK